MRTYTWALLILAGCGPVAVGGVVDGENVGGARDAFWDTVEFGQLEYTIVVVADFEDACAVNEAFVDEFAFDCEERCEEYLAIAEQYELDQERYWSLSFTLNTTDTTIGVFDQDLELGDEEFVATFSSWDAVPLRDPAACEEACEDNELLAPELEEAEGGTLEITDEDGEVLEGRFEVGLGGEDELEGRFAARRCDMDVWNF